MTNDEMQALCSRFLRGDSIPEVSVFFACRQETAEAVIRSMLQQLVLLHANTPIPATEEAVIAHV